MFAYTAAQKNALRLLSGPARHTMLFGGSRSGKTFVLCCAILIRAGNAPGSRHAIIRRHFNGVKTSIGMDTLPKALRLRFGGWNVTYNQSDSVFRLANKSEIWLIGLDDAQRADKILGKEFATLYFNECSELDYSSIQTALTRLAQNCPKIRNRAFYDCNPPSKSHWAYRVFVQHLQPVDRTALRNPGDYASMRINPEDNRENLPEGYIEETLGSLSLRQRQRFLLGEWLDDTEGALWRQSMIDSARVVNAPELVRVVVGVDPAVTGGEESDYTGIVAVGMGVDGDFYVLADRSCRTDPLSWCREVVKLCREFEADRVVGEVNNGGDLIEGLLRQVDPDLPFRAVRASHGKIIRAEPAAALYEKGRVHHVGAFPELEEEMTSFAPLTATKSPDRMDALVWALAELAKGGQRFILA